MGEDESVIIVKNVTKAFAIPHEKRTTLFENILGALRPATYEHFTALDDVSFSVKKGEWIGIIGDNGSGKSTLLKIIANILRPSIGSVKIKGRLTPFLELGVGFQPDMTARENIEIYSTIMGLSGREIADNMDRILDYAGLAKFKDTKLKNLSSGMQVRLAFATAIQIKPEILLIDEVLAVGDIEFQQKCFDTFTTYRQQGITAVFVSHDLNSIRKYCDRAIQIKNGKVVACGEVNSVIDHYVYGRQGAREESAPAEAAPVAVPQDSAPPAQEPAKEARWGNRQVMLTRIAFIDKYGNENTTFSSGDPMVIRIYYTVAGEVDGLNMGVAIYREDNLYCFGTTTSFRKFTPESTAGNHSLDLSVKAIPMIEGRYFVTLAAVSASRDTYDYHDRLYSFTVRKETEDIGLFNIDCMWLSSVDR